MRWRAYLGDTMTGLVGAPIDLPNFSWSVSVSDSSLSTTKDKNVGADTVSSLTVPWAAVPGDTPTLRSAALAPARRSIVLCRDLGDGTLGVPILWGAIGPRRDSWLDTSFDLDSALTLLDSRYMVREGVYGAGDASTSPDQIYLSGLSLRGIASEVGHQCTNAKPAGALPIDWTYRGEPGDHERTYEAFNIANLSGKAIFEKLANVLGGPDMQFRPYLADPQHVRLAFLAGSDADVVLGQSVVHSLRLFPGGGDLQDATLDHAGPIMRVYGSGSGTDAAQITHLSADLALAQLGDPWPLVEATFADSDADDADLLARDTEARLAANCRPLMQLSGTLDCSDEHTPQPGEFWPGEVFEVSIDGFPTLPGGVYPMRLMEMSGDQTSRVKLVFDVMDNPIY